MYARLCARAAGERGFSFGVDDEWVPHEVPTAEDMSSVPSKSHLGGPEPSTKRASTTGTAGRAGDALTKVRATLKEPAKRLAFYEKQDWARLQQLLIDSGMLERDASEMGGVKVVIERASAGLSIHQLLGAISPSLLPRCSLLCLLIQRPVDRNSAPQAPWPCSPSRRSTT